MIGLYHHLALALFAGFALVELAAGTGRFPPQIRWQLTGTGFFLLYLALGTALPLLWDGWLGEHRLFAADRLPLWQQILFGFLVLELGIYGWHRTMHNVPVLWRWFHQMHHSVERIDVWSAFYFHPLDMFGWTLLTSLVLVLGFGVGVDAAIAINLAATFMNMFGHANVRTPRWLGYLIARPESHAAHHERDVHARNYSDLPLIDMVFGTFYNPPDFPRAFGFSDGASRRLAAMLIGKDVAEVRS